MIVNSPEFSVGLLFYGQKYPPGLAMPASLPISLPLGNSFGGKLSVAGGSRFAWELWLEDGDRWNFHVAALAD